jgi:hypothetical protein
MSSLVLYANVPNKFEQEPNDLAVNATVFRGETTLHGELTPKDTDHFLWKVSKKDTLRNWEMSVSPLPKGSITVTFSKVVFQKVGLSTVSFSKNAKELKSKTKIFSFTNDSGHAVQTLSPLVVEKGTYLVTVDSTATTPYKLSFIKKEKVYGNAAKTQRGAKNISLNSLYLHPSKAQEAWFKFNISKKDKNKVWQINSSVTLADIQSMSVLNDSQEVLAKVTADGYGKMFVDDLELDVGNYYVHYANAKNKSYALEVRSIGTQTVDKEETEPNNSKAEANTIRLSKIIHGQVGQKNDNRDFFTFQVPSDFKHKVFDIHIKSEDKTLKVTLLDAYNVVQIKSADSNYTFSGLSLNHKGRYYLEIYKYSEDTNYSISFSKPYTLEKSNEIEPNDTPKMAPNIENNETMYGKFVGEEKDCSTFTITRNNLFWSMLTKGDALERMYFYHKNIEILRTTEQIENTLRFENLFLTKGSYTLCILGKTGGYKTTISHKSMQELNISSLGDFEYEPNQNASQANHLQFGKSKQGLLETKSNEDFFYFTLENSEYIRLTAIPPKDGNINIKLIGEQLIQRAYPREENLSIIEGIYPAGRYVIDLFTDKPNFNAYTLTLERLSPFGSKDVEPNNSYAQAISMPYTQTLKGHTSSEDKDYYTFPQDINETNIMISGKNLKNNIYIYPNPKGHTVPLVWNEQNKSYHALLKTPKISYMYVNSGVGHYNYKIHFSNYSNKKIIPIDAILRLDIPSMHPRSYYHLGQIFNFEVFLKNELSKNQTFFLGSHSSNSSWKIHCEEEYVALLPESEKSISCQVFIPKNVSADEVVISLKIENHKGSFQSKNFTLIPNDTAHPLASFKDWSIPKAFVGTLNVARVDLGAKRVLEHNETALGYVPKIGKYYHYLFDDIVHGGNGFYLAASRTNIDENVSIQLLSDIPVSVIGVAFKLKGQYLDTFLKDFTVWLSEDGEHYKKVYSASLKATLTEQHFSFRQSYQARYAKLTLHNNQSGQPLGSISLGEWKVLAMQETLTVDKAFNIANPKLGGHIVSASKRMSHEWDKYLLTPKKDVSKLVFDKDETSLTWVLGFKNERVAKLTQMVWQEADKSSKKSRFGNVKLYVSTQTPIGPWKEVGFWERNTTLDDNRSSYTFKKPTWARYVKFSMDVNQSRYANPYYPPESLEVYEAKPNDNYKSIQGEWGEKNHESYYEYLQVQQEKIKTAIVGNEDRKNAYLLEENTSIYGEVSVAKHQKDWYVISVPKGKNTLTLTLENKESVDVSYLLYDANNSLLKEAIFQRLPQKHTMTFLVSEGQYYLNIYQPPVNVVFAWDNSGSVSVYEKQISFAVNAYVDEIKEDIDHINLLCFNERNRFILSDFSNKKEEIERIFHDFSWNCSSSAAEVSLNIATQALKSKKGTKGVIIIADAEGIRDINLWKTLETVRPKVFSIRVASSYESRIYEGLMQGWSRINNGTYSVVENATEMIQAINHASHILRRPVFYDVSIKTDYVRPLRKGSLVVVNPKSSKMKKVDKSFAIELILDASGSMLKRIKGKRRIEIAKDVLIKAVQEIIPTHTLVALRVFGHKKADSCRTDLEMRLQALNVKKTSKIIKRIKAKNLAKTPIAASLAKVASDLKTVKGKRVIILVTDGKETCDGNATQEIEKLKALGIDVRLNIVGFAIDDAKLKKEFEAWAKLGNGEYFEANDKKSLDAAVKKALQIPYSIYSLEGEQLYKGVVGDEGLTLKGGVYKVIVESSPQKVFNEVRIIGEEATIIDITKQQKRKK